MRKLQLSGGDARLVPERKDLWKVVLAVLFLFGMTTLYVFEIPFFGKTFDVGILAAKALAFGAILGVWVAGRFTTATSSALEKVKIYLFITTLTATFMPLVASLSNRLLTHKPVMYQTVEFVKCTPYKQGRYGLTKDDIRNGMHPSGYYLFFVRQDRIYRMSFSQPLFQEVKRGDMIQIPIQKGLWGYEVVRL